MSDSIIVLLLNNLTVILLKISEFISTSIISCFINYGFEGLVIVTIIYLTSKAGKVLDTVAKVVTISAGSTILYNN
jgi:hypothetical protein